MKRLLDQLIICVNYHGLLDTDIDTIVKDSRDFFTKKGFSVKENFIPEPSGKVSKKYTFTKDKLSLNITKNSLDISVLTSEKYDGFEVYKEHIIHIVEKIQSHCGNMMEVSRIGVRKINSIVLKHVEKIGDYVNENLFNCNVVNDLLLEEDGGAVLASHTHLSLCNDKCKSNLITDIQIGEARAVKDEKEEVFEVHRVILDIDSYWDNSLKKYDSIDNVLSTLNDTASRIYLKCLTNEFKEKLTNETNFDDGNLLGGIKG